MTLQLCYTSDHDAKPIADIHMAAFANNKMLQTQFPTPDIRAGLWHSVVKKALADIHDPHIAVLVIRDMSLKDNDNEKSRVISFAKWSLPTSTSENETPWEWPAGTRLDILEDLKKRLRQAERRALGHDYSYRLTYLATHPAHERQGAGTMLVRWAIDSCESGNIPLYVESTSSAEILYRNLGYKVEETVSTILDDSSVYDRIVLTYRP